MNILDPKRPRQVDPLKPMTPAWCRRQAIWRHNAARGQVCMSRTIMHSIQQLETTTNESKALAVQVELLLEQLAASLLTRKDSK